MNSITIKTGLNEIRPCSIVGGIARFTASDSQTEVVILVIVLLLQQFVHVHYVCDLLLQSCVLRKLNN